MRLMNSTPQTIVRYVRGVVPRGVQTMSDDNSGSTIELNRRRVLGALGTIGVASAGAGAGTFALFSDTETSSGNSVQAGTLDLTDGDGGSVSTTISDSDLVPGSTGTLSFQIENEGSVSGSVDFGIQNVSVTPQTTGETDPDDAPPAGGSRFVANALANGNALDTPVEIDVDHAGDTITLSFPSSAGGASFGSLALLVDSDNNGTPDVHQIYQPGANGVDGDGLAYKEISGSGWGSIQSGPDPELADATVDTANEQITLDFGSDGLADTIAVGGFIYYGNNGRQVGLSPGFRISSGPNGSTGFSNDPDSSQDYLTLTQGQNYDLADALSTDFYVDPDTGTSGDEVVIADGKLSRIEGSYDQNYTLDGTDTVKVDYLVAPEVGNSVQGDSVTFDVEVELNQEDSQ